MTTGRGARDDLRQAARRLPHGAREREGNTTNGYLASYILEHPGEVREMTLTQLDESCAVGTGTVSRFCRDIGLRDFAELRELLTAPGLDFERESNKDQPAARLDDYTRAVEARIAEVFASLDMRAVDRLCERIHDAARVSIYGLLKAGGVAFNLQSDLLMLGKRATTSTSYVEQMKQLAHTTRDDLVVVFSYTGSYFDYSDLGPLHRQLMVPEIWMVGGGDSERLSFVNGEIRFLSTGDLAGYPHQLQVVESVIAQEYAALYS